MRVNIGHFLTTWRQRKFFIRLLSSTIFVAIIPTLVLCTITYYNVSNSYAKTLSDNNAQYLYQTINAIEIVIDQLKDSSQQLMLDSSFKEFETFPNGSYYENLSGSINEDDLAANYHYLRNKKDVIMTIQSFLLSNQFVESVYFYNDEKQIVMTVDRDSNKQFSYNDFYDKDWYDLIHLNQLSPIVMETRTVKTINNKNMDYFTVIHRTNKKENALIINLDAELVYDSIIQKINNSDSIYVLSSTGHMMFPYDRTETNKQVEEFLKERMKTDSSEGSFTDELINREVMVTYAQSPLLDWQFYHLEDLDDLHQSLNYLQDFILLLTVTLIGFIILLAILLSHRLYQPIKRISNQFGVNNGEKASDYPVDEFKTIDNILQTTLEQRDQFKKRFEESYPTFQEKFKRELLRKGSYSKKEIEEKKEYLKIEIEAENLIVLLFSLDDYYSINDRVEQGDLYKIQIEEIIKNSPYSNRKFFIVDIEEDKLAMVLNISKKESEDIASLGENIINYLYTKIQGSITVGISNFYKSIIDLPIAYIEAKEALNYKLILGQGRAIRISEVNQSQKQQYFYPKDKIDRLTDFVKAGNTIKAKEIYHQIVETINQNKKHLHYNQILPVFVQILTNLIDVLQRADIKTEEIFEENPYHQLDDLGDIDTISIRIEQWVEMVSNNIYQHMGAKGNENVFEIKKLLNENFDEDVSLNMIGEELNLNPAYISRLFKQHTGKTVIEYLKEIRIEKSKELLVESKLKVNEISKQVGYQNSYYFIKVFKKKTGTTPGEFRKIKRKT